MTKPTKRIADLSATDLVVKLGVSRSYASELLRRLKTPSLEMAVRIEVEFGVPASAWMQDACLMASLPHNEARNAEIIRRRKAGEWPTDIAKAMGLSRNVVIGVCNRAGLCDWEAGSKMSRGHPGETHWKAKLTVEQVREIRRRGGAPYRELSKEFGVSEKTIGQVFRGETWASVA